MKLLESQGRRICPQSIRGSFLIWMHGTRKPAQSDVYVMQISKGIQSIRMVL